MRWKAVLIDMGGVILHMAGSRGFPRSQLDWRGRQALLRLLHDRGGHLGEDELDRLLFRPWMEGYRRRQERGREEPWSPHLRGLRRAAGVRLRDLSLLRAWFRPYGDQLTPIAGAGEALERLRSSGAALALVSNVPLPGRLYREILAGHGLDSHFASFHFSYDSGSRKPSPAMIREALAKLEVAPGQAVMVGDRLDRDVAAGRAAGTATIWIDGAGEASGPAPDLKAASVTEVPALLRAGPPSGVG